MDIGADFAREEADTFPALRADLLPPPDLPRLEPVLRHE